MALDREAAPDQPVGDLVSQAITLRPPGAGSGPYTERLADWLAYDVALVRLCERLGVSHGMLDGDAGPATRARAEALLVERMPSLSGSLGEAWTGEARTTGRR